MKVNDYILASDIGMINIQITYFKSAILKFEGKWVHDHIARMWKNMVFGESGSAPKDEKMNWEES